LPTATRRKNNPFGVGMKTGLRLRCFISQHSTAYESLSVIVDTKAIRARINYLIELGLQYEEHLKSNDKPAIPVDAGITPPSISESKPKKRSVTKPDKASSNQVESSAKAITSGATPGMTKIKLPKTDTVNAWQ
jgi:hypothetical protein